MRKIIAVLIVVCAVGFYVVHLVNVEKQSTESTSQEKSVKEQLEDDKKQLTEDYPKTPAEVMKIYNSLLEIAYGGTMPDDVIDLYIEDTRLLYTDAFNELNPIETQKEALTADITNNIKNKVNIVASTIGEVYVLQNEQNQETEATVTVVHAMNNSAVTRKYLLKKENDKWKINGWESQGDSKTEE